MKYLIINILVILVFKVSSQTVIFEQQVDTASNRPKWGQNCRHFLHAYINIGNIAARSEKGASVIYPGSLATGFGLRYKLKLTSWYALVAETEMNGSRVYLKQNQGKLLPDNTRHDAEYYLFKTAGLSIMQRLNVGRRGDIIGKYIELGIYATGEIQTRHVMVDKNMNAGASRTKTINLNPSYISTFNYGIAGRAGFNWFSVFARYRLSDRFTTLSGNTLPEIPRLTIGVDFALIFR